MSKFIIYLLFFDRKMLYKMVSVSRHVERLFRQQSGKYKKKITEGTKWEAL